MKNYKITVNGTAYEVEVEEIGGAPVVQSVQKAAPSAVATPKTPAAPAQKAAVPPAGKGDVVTAVKGNVWKIVAAEGDSLKEGAVIMILESMKMEIEVNAPAAGTLTKIHVSEGQAVDAGAVVATIG